METSPVKKSQRLMKKLPENVDFRINKNDIVDMVIDERLNELDEAYKIAKQNQDRASARLQRTVVALTERAKAYATKHYAKLIKALESVADVKKATVDETLSFSTIGGAEPSPWSNLSTAADWHTALRELAKIRVPLEIDIAFNCERRQTGASGHFNWRVTAEWLKEHGTGVRDAVLDFVVQKALAEEAKREIDLLTKRGARVKAKLVRHILEQTEDGKQLLDSVKDFTQQVQLALTESTSG